MRKLILSLLSVATCLSLFAAPPRVNKDAKVTNGKPGSAMLSKGNTLAQQLIAPALGQTAGPASNALTPQRFFAERGLTPNDNQLMHKAPRRLSDDDMLLNNKLAFMIAYEYDEDNDQVVMSKNCMQGGWETGMEKADENYFYAYMYFDQIPFGIYVDYDNHHAELETGFIGGWNWADTVVSGRSTIISDTTEYICLFDENYLFNSDAEEPMNIQGEIYDDGSIYFPDGWAVYLVDYVTKTTIRNNIPIVTYDTVAGLMTDIMRDTYLLTSNATHDYDYQGDGTTAYHYQNLAYMFQADTTLAIAWNLWGMGGRGTEFNFYEDGSMVLPCMQVVATGDVEDLESYYPDYDWQTYGYSYYNVDGDWNEADQYGIVTHKTLEWDATAWARLCVGPSSGGGDVVRSIDPQAADGLSNTGSQVNSAIYMVCYYPLLNNVLSFTRDVDMLWFGYTDDPVINTELTDRAVIVSLELEDDAYYELMVDGELVNSPYSIPRTHEEQTVQVQAAAQVYGKWPSHVVSSEVIVPAKEIGDFGFDVGDAEVLHGDTVVIPVSMVNPGDVTAFQTDLYLPEGFELVEDVEMTGRAVDHVCETNTMPDGAIRIVCYSVNLTPFDGDDGVLFNLTISTPDESAGDYSIWLKNNLLTTVSGSNLECDEIQCADVDGTLTVLPYLMGDANDSRSVTVTDVVVTVMNILGKNPEPFVFGAADMNYNGEVTVTDAVLIARKVLFPDLRHLLRAPAMGQNDDAMSGVGINIRAGETRTVTINLDNEALYTAFQLDLQLPEGLTASNFAMTDRAGSHAVDANVLDNGKHRVMCYSPQLETIAGDSGALLTFEVTATENVSGDIMVDGIEMVTADCQTAYLEGFAIQVNNGGSTALNEMGGDVRITAEGHDIIIDSPVAQRAIISDIAGRARSVNLNAGHNVIHEAASGVFIVRVGQHNAKLMLR